MANLRRTMAVGVGGPLDGQFFSVGENQQTIEGMNDMGEHEIYTRKDDSRRPFEGHEAALAKLLFDPNAHNLSEVVEYHYGTDS